MIQNGVGKMKNVEIRALTKASIEGTPWKSSLDTINIWNEVRKKFPNHVDSSLCSMIEDIREIWTTFSN